ncbi:MAG: tetratricopeptide repeat protein [Opitutales bacterium]|jgi:tetratricopeptide (TPR) repeat protein
MKLPTAIFSAAACFALAAATATAQTSAPVTPSLALPPAPVPASTPSLALAPSAPSTPVDPDTAFSTGLAAYENGNFAEARRLFSAAEPIATSFALEYNLANACYQLGDQADAILHYLRALALNPRDPDARQNLSLARQAVNLTVPDPTFLERLSSGLSVNAWACLLAFFGWVALYLLFLPRLYRWNGASPWLCFAVSFAIAAIALAALGQDHLHSHDGVILRAGAKLKLSPVPGSEDIGVLQAGEVAESLRQHPGYYYIRAADGRLGWVEAINYAPVYD